MLITPLRRWFATPIDRPFSFQTKFWFSLSLIYSAVYGLLGLKSAFRSEYVVDGDARVFLIWMQRFLDPELMPNDLITDYSQSITPPGYATLYQLMAHVGIDPFLFSKLLPLLLGLIATAYCFGVCLQIFPVPTAGFITTLLLNQNLCVRNDWSSATPRAFVYPLFLAFLYYLLRRSLLPCLVAIALQGLFFPPFVFISLGILALRLLRWESRFPCFSQNRSDYLFFATGLGVALLVMLPYALLTSEFGPTVSLAEARILPEFSAKGRSPFFLQDPLTFWIWGINSGIMPCDLSQYLHFHRIPPLNLAALLLPILLAYPFHFPLAKQITSKVTLLAQIIFASLVMFFAAHALLFKLYAPSRYTQHSLRFAIALAAGIVLTTSLDAVFRACEQQAKMKLKLTGLFFAVYTLLLTIYWLLFYSPGHKKVLVALLTMGLGVILILPRLDRFFPQSQQRGKTYIGRQFLALASTVLLGVMLFIPPYPANTSYRVGEFPSLYEFFAQQPKETLVASLTTEVDNLPVFSHRSILVGHEYAIPLQLGYYHQIRKRATDLIRAQYSQNLVDVQDFIQKYGVDFWLIDRAAFTPEYLARDSSQNFWLRQFEPTTEALEKLESGKSPALARLIQNCSAFQVENLVVLQAECISQASQE